MVKVEDVPEGQFHRGRRDGPLSTGGKVLV